MPGRSPQPPSLDAGPARSWFALALFYLLTSALIGLALRFNMLWPQPGFHPGHWLHTHSHLAFQGWIFNALLALFAGRLETAGRVSGWRAPWWVLQAGVAGMLFSFPVQGYGAVSIAFSTLHLAGSVWAAVRLWGASGLAPATRLALRLAVAFMLLSSAGPLSLGPLAACGLRDSPVYAQAVYLYLHFQYNGLFLFFLLAFWHEAAVRRGLAAVGSAPRRPLLFLGAGCLLTAALSPLVSGGSAWWRLPALAGGLLQLAGCVLLVRGQPGPGALWPGADPESLLRRCVAWLVIAAFLAKHGLQCAAALPGFTELAGERPSALAFLHLVFLGVVTPFLVLWALEAGWLRPGLRTWLGFLGLLSGALLMGLVLGLAGLVPALGLPLSPLSPHALVLSSALLVLGALLLVLQLRRRQDSGHGA